MMQIVDPSNETFRTSLSASSKSLPSQVTQADGQNTRKTYASQWITVVVKYILQPNGQSRQSMLEKTNIFMH